MRRCCKEVLPKPEDPELRARTTIQKTLLAFLPSRREADNMHRSCLFLVRDSEDKAGAGSGGITTVRVLCYLYQLLFSFFTLFPTEWIRI